MSTIQRIAPCLWFDHQAEEAALYYVSIFPNSAIRTITRYGKAEMKKLDIGELERAAAG